MRAAVYAGTLYIAKLTQDVAADGNPSTTSFAIEWIDLGLATEVRCPWIFSRPSLCAAHQGLGITWNACLDGTVHRALTSCLSDVQAEIEQYIITNLKFSDIFETAAPTASSPYCADGFTPVNVGDKLLECLKLKVTAGYAGIPLIVIGSFVATDPVLSPLSALFKWRV